MGDAAAGLAWGGSRASFSAADVCSAMPRLRHQEGRHDVDQQRGRGRAGTGRSGDGRLALSEVVCGGRVGDVERVLSAA
jgi:hypothetical protein